MSRHVCSLTTAILGAHASLCELVSNAVSNPAMLCISPHVRLLHRLMQKLLQETSASCRSVLSLHIDH